MCYTTVRRALCVARQFQAGFLCDMLPVDSSGDVSFYIREGSYVKQCCFLCIVAIGADEVAHVKEVF